MLPLTGTRPDDVVLLLQAPQLRFMIRAKLPDLSFDPLCQPDLFEVLESIYFLFGPDVGSFDECLKAVVADDS